jgi:uncharacterized membrane protein
MNGILWALQILLALVFLVTGMMKVVRPKEQLVTQMDWVVESPQPVVWLVGLLEILGAAFTNYQHKEYSKIGLKLINTIKRLRKPINQNR